MAKTLVIGYGNPLRGDDALGWRAAERLRQILDGPDFEIRTLHQLTPELMDSIACMDRVIFVDASSGQEPGAIAERRVSPENAPPSTFFTHHATPEALVAGALLLYGRAAECRIFTLTGADFSCSENLSVIVESKLDDLVQAIVRAAQPEG